jgi:hypothetical protein
MPMSFPDFESLKDRAELRNFRQPHEGETESEFRTAFADFMQSIDRVESSEIRTGRGWDNQHPFELLANALGLGNLSALMTNLSSPEEKEVEEVTLALSSPPHMFFAVVGDQLTPVSVRSALRAGFLPCKTTYPDTDRGVVIRTKQGSTLPARYIKDLGWHYAGNKPWSMEVLEGSTWSENTKW